MKNKSFKAYEVRLTVDSRWTVVLASSPTNAAKRHITHILEVRTIHFPVVVTVKEPGKIAHRIRIRLQARKLP